MTRIDLITGFLGAGKTTWLKRYVHLLAQQGENVCVLENDFGAVNTDVLLLKDALGNDADLESVAGGCDADCHRRRFKTRLISLGMLGYDRVVIEPSGIFDPDELLDVLSEEPLDRWYTLGNIMAIVDGSRPVSQCPSDRYILATEIADAGAVLLSHTEDADEESLKKTVDELNAALASVKCSRRICLYAHPREGCEPVVYAEAQTWMEEPAASAIFTCGHVISDYEKHDIERDFSYESLCLMQPGLSAEELSCRIRRLFSDPGCGRILRVKGFCRICEKEGADGWLQINAVPAGMEESRIAEGQDVVIVIGEELSEERIRACLLEDMTPETVSGEKSLEERRDV